ncbi:hypothetical protein [Niabella beijingensis]|uniref:hypothetical protein n=1 Tax=Niabella beijingensis TaxID=2872700 RepID=UPI001CBFBAF6|nr:hypothetical protein [Niabella beijingensis]MBZ4188005.1 hypothetical protein [Niabella beijingensis]
MKQVSVLFTWAVLLIVAVACRKGVDVSKENRLQLEKYSRVLFRSIPEHLEIQYNKTKPPYYLDGFYFLPPGKGTVQLIDSTGKMTLNQEVQIAPGNDMLDYVPVSDTSSLLMKNTQSEELMPDPGYIKLKFLNLAKTAIGEAPVDIVITQYQIVLREIPEDPWFIEDTVIIARDTLADIDSGPFTTAYKLFKPRFRPGAGPYTNYLSILRSSDKMVIPARGAFGSLLDINAATSSYSDEHNTVFTYIFTDEGRDDWTGMNITGLRLMFVDKGK